MPKSVEERLAGIEQFLIDHAREEDRNSDRFIEAIKDLRQVILQQNGRVRRLEIWRGVIVGGMGVMGVVLPLAWEVLRRLL